MGLGADTIEVLEIIHKMYETDRKATTFLLTMYPNTCGTRKSNDLNLNKILIAINKTCFQFFTNRINNTWNDLPNEVANEDNIDDNYHPSL